MLSDKCTNSSVYILYMLQWAYPNTEPKIAGQAYAFGQVY